ncbi:putative membrane protein YfcA [Bacillus pakistanensis]|uniref:Probable membrane transporter protein n=1 Tax=Rossellomorea pakistanensis TaxID=992288 RepID=A0ABS2NFN8_9BACI|nr:sulfite exporter TauE/SafE family protein [Bacillus pakistanensis]MBM7586647.1 putative membrane protein YfcA [Bacillus pakistanensis]
MMILMFMTGLFVAFIGTFAGSGGLIGMPIMLIVGLPVHTAIATAKFSNMISSFSSFYYLLKMKKVEWNEARNIIPIAITGGITGGLIASYISPKVMEIIAILLLLFALLLSLWKKPSKNEKESKNKQRLSPLLFSIAVYDGVFGPGQATLLMYLYLNKGFQYIKAVAFTRFQTFLSCTGAFIMYFSNDYFDWKVGIPFALGGLIGAQMAVRFTDKISAKNAKLLLNIITMLLIIQLIYSLF